MLPIRHVLCATDLNGNSRRAFDAATTLVILHVSRAPVFPPDARLDAPTTERLRTRARARDLKRLQKLSAQARRRGVTAAVLLRDGEPGDQIVRAGRAARVDLIVMGTHGRRGLKRLYLGSVARHVAASAPCPVMTVRGS
jgi:nucleotide-binding universal stress UspA family protein